MKNCGLLVVVLSIGAVDCANEDDDQAALLQRVVDVQIEAGSYDYPDGPRVDSSTGNCDKWYGSLSDAQAKCDAMSTCAGLHDWGCDQKNWRFCTAAAFKNKGDAKACSKTKVSAAATPAPPPPPPPAKLSTGQDFVEECSNCGCSGSKYIDYIQMETYARRRYNRIFKTAEACYKRSKDYSWCGDQFFVHSKLGACYCMHEGCKQAGGSLSVYRITEVTTTTTTLARTEARWVKGVYGGMGEHHGWARCDDGEVVTGFIRDYVECMPKPKPTSGTTWKSKWVVAKAYDAAPLCPVGEVVTGVMAKNSWSKVRCSPPGPSVAGAQNYINKETPAGGGSWGTAPHCKDGYYVKETSVSKDSLDKVFCVPW